MKLCINKQIEKKEAPPPVGEKRKRPVLIGEKGSRVPEPGNIDNIIRDQLYIQVTLSS